MNFVLPSLPQNIRTLQPPSYDNNPNIYSSQATDARTRTTDPYVTGTSVIAMKYKDGVIMSADTMASYGSMARFRQLSRMTAIGDVLLGASGEISDFQYVVEELNAMRTKEYNEGDNMSLDARETWSYLTRRMYQQRNEFDPLWNQFVLAGCKSGKPFLGLVDLHGTNYEDDTIATGYGSHLARPILRNAVQEKGTNMTLEEAQKVMETAMRVLFYRDCRTTNRVQFAIVTAEGVQITEPRELSTYWEFGQFVKSGYA
eukprot:TRINITY_DN8776_c0_g1_i1.p1 TRINITY_DN8776_c0_g1~~TRINITY_DN8776_c0_g1_i1.p1  ORF type:complete len:258 (-),score=59.34 TRINITY_DN8776_c0_g1_i1:49-822(-)